MECFAPGIDLRHVCVRASLRRLNARQIVPAERIATLIHRQIAAPAGFRAFQVAPLHLRQIRAVARVGARIFPVARAGAMTNILPAAVRTHDETAARPVLRMLRFPMVAID
jgi:hypothetical protein